MAIYPYIPPSPGTAQTNYGQSWDPLAGNPTTSPYTNYLVGENGVVNGMIQDIFTNWQTQNGAPQLFPGDPQWPSSSYPGGPGNTSLGGMMSGMPYEPSSGIGSGNPYSSIYGSSGGSSGGGDTGGGGATGGAGGATGGGDGTQFAGHRKLNLSA